MNLPSLSQYTLDVSVSAQNYWKDEIRSLLNDDRAKSSYKPLTAKFIAIKLSHLKEEKDLQRLYDLMRQKGCYYFWEVGMK